MLYIFILLFLRPMESLSEYNNNVHTTTKFKPIIAIKFTKEHNNVELE